MSSAGSNEEFQKVLDKANKKITDKLGFVKRGEDILRYVGSLTFCMKSERGDVLFKDTKNEMQCYPCVTKFVSFTDPSIKFPGDKKRNPFECAKIQYMLCRKSNVNVNTHAIEQKTANFKCDCHDCYILALEGIFKGGGLCL